MRYMLLIYNDPIERDRLMEGISPEQMAELMQGWFDYTASLQDQGIYRAGDALEGLDTATTVRVRNGETLVSDGPFAETKEALGGYYIIECDTLDVAIEAASRIPTAPFGSVEVRPLMEFEQ
jgi:hypothetical protein